VWQALRSELHPQGLEVVTIALDVNPEHARPFIEAAKPDHPSLIDRRHLLDELFGVVNVPYGVWIDEQGTIVRPAGPAHVRPSSYQRIRDGQLDLGHLPPFLLEMIKAFKVDPEGYVGGLRDWAARGAESEWAHTPDEVIELSQPRSDAHARAAAHFELGEFLHERGEIESAQQHWQTAHRLYPENFTYKRQAWHLVAPFEQGPNDVYDGYWIKDVTELGPENYVPPLRP
jgi:hypothetical protein